MTHRPVPSNATRNIPTGEHRQRAVSRRGAGMGPWVQGLQISCCTLAAAGALLVGLSAAAPISAQAAIARPSYANPCLDAHYDVHLFEANGYSDNIGKWLAAIPEVNQARSTFEAATNPEDCKEASRQAAAAREHLLSLASEEVSHLEGDIGPRPMTGSRVPERPRVEARTIRSGQGCEAPTGLAIPRVGGSLFPEPFRHVWQRGGGGGRVDRLGTPMRAASRRIPRRLSRALTNTTGLRARGRTGELRAAPCVSPLEGKGRALRVLCANGDT